MELNIRRLQPEDLEIINEWWEAWPDWVNPGIGFLPETGVVVTAGEKPILAAFIYFTNAQVALFEWIISDPNYREDNRQEAVELLIQGAESVIKSQGYKFMFSISKHKKLMNTMENLGFHVDREPSYELLKLIE